MMEFLKNNWIKILVAIIILIIVLGIIKTLNSVLNCSGPICQGMKDIAGAVAGAINAVTSGCTTQPDCSPLKDKDTCNNVTDCSWSSSSTSGVCVNTTGRSTGSGGFWSLDCGLGLGFFLALIGVTLVSGAIKWIIKRNPKSENIKTESQLRGEDVGTVAERVVKRARELATKAKEFLKEKLGGKEPPDAQVRATSAQVTSAEAANSAINAAKGRGTPAELAKDLAHITEVQGAENKAIEDQANKDGLDPQEQSDADDAAQQAEREAPDAVALRINAYQVLNRVPSQNAHKLLTKKVNYHLRNGNFIHPDHINFLNSIKY